MDAPGAGANKTAWVRTAVKDGDQMVISTVSTLRLIDQKHHPEITYGTFEDNKSSGENDKKKLNTANDIIKSASKIQKENFEDGPAKNSNRGARKVMTSSATNSKQIQKVWQADFCGTNEHRQYNRQILTNKTLNSVYSSAYSQMLSASMLNSQTINLNSGLDVRSLIRGKTCCWKGELPPRNYCNPVFSSKVFVGGVPWDITETALIESFSKYGTCRVEWPNKESLYARTNPEQAKVTGYVYIIFENDWAVKKLLQDCSQQGKAAEWYFKLIVPRIERGLETRQVQIIPWVTSDASYIIHPNVPLDSKKTVFVGALHGMITAKILFSIMRDVYGDVLYVGIDTDRQKYPIGSARVTFSTQSSYFHAVESGHLEIRTSKFTKRVQIDPFLEDAKCSQCECVQGPYFCREKSCFKYFCMQCWEVRHALSGPYGDHRAMVRPFRRPHTENCFVYSPANYHVSCDPRIVPGQYVGRIAPKFGIPLNVPQTGSFQVAEINKSTNMKFAFGQPTYLWPSCPKQTLQQVQVWVPPANQAGIIKEDNVKHRAKNSFTRMPFTSTSSSESHTGSGHSDFSHHVENANSTFVASGTASTSSSVPSNETISSNSSP